MPRNHTGSNRDRSEYYGALQRIVDVLFESAEEEAALKAASAEAAESAASPAPGASDDRFAALFGVSRETLLGGGEAAAAASPEPEAVTVRRLDVIIQAEAADLPDDLMRIVTLIPPGDYTRQRLCDQLNSAINGHAWGQVYGTVC